MVEIIWLAVLIEIVGFAALALSVQRYYAAKRQAHETAMQQLQKERTALLLEIHKKIEQIEINQEVIGLLANAVAYKGETDNDI